MSNSFVVFLKPGEIMDCGKEGKEIDLSLCGGRIYMYAQFWFDAWGDSATDSETEWSHLQNAATLTRNLWGQGACQGRWQRAK